MEYVRKDTWWRSKGILSPIVKISIIILTLNFCGLDSVFKMKWIAKKTSTEPIFSKVQMQE